jgi:citronellol/citronellal dehydrogenase
LTVVDNAGSYRSCFQPGLFAGQIHIVTGGSSGIGRCTAHELAHLGSHVVIVGRNAEKLETVRTEIAEDGGAVSAFVGNVRDEETVVALVDRVLTDHGKIDGIANIAGGQYRAALRDISTGGFEAVVRNNLSSTFIMMREAYNRAMADNGGAIVNMLADIWGGWPMYAHSGAARGGALTLTESAAAEWGHSGVRINAVAPGSIASSGLDTYENKDDEYLKRDVSQEIPVQRYGTESEVSAAIVFLLSPAASFITGTTIRVDGGAPNGARMWPTVPAARNNEPYDGFHRSVWPSVLSR